MGDDPTRLTVTYRIGDRIEWGDGVAGRMQGLVTDIDRQDGGLSLVVAAEGETYSLDLPVVLPDV